MDQHKKRGREGALLEVTGRDIEPRELCANRLYEYPVLEAGRPHPPLFLAAAQGAGLAPVTIRLLNRHSFRSLGLAGVPRRLLLANGLHNTAIEQRCAGTGQHPG